MVATWEINENRTECLLCKDTPYAYRVSVFDNEIDKVFIRLKPTACDYIAETIEIIPGTSVDIGPGMRSIFITYADDYKDTNHKKTKIIGSYKKVEGYYEIIPTHED